MRKQQNESFEQWANSAREYEKNLAAKKIEQGQDPYIVLEEFAQRLLNKLLHPVYQQAQMDNKLDLDQEQDKRIYEETYLKNRKPVADQVDGNLFDNSREI